MGMSEFDLIARRIKDAKHPEDIFGSLEGDDPIKAGRAIYRTLSKATHPDLHSDPDADDVFGRLSNLWSQAEDKLKTGKYGIAINANVRVVIPKAV